MRRIWYLVVCRDIQRVYYGQYQKNGSDIREELKKALIKKGKDIGVQTQVIGEYRALYRPARAIVLAEERLFCEPGAFADFDLEEVNLV